MKYSKPIMAGSFALSLAVAGVSFGQQQPNASSTVEQRQMQMNARTGQPEVTFVAVRTYVPVKLPALPAGFDAKDLKEADDIRETIASATEAALTENGFKDLVERLVDQDRTRIGKTEISKQQKDLLDGRVAQIRKAFKEKYGKEFDIDDQAVVFNDRYPLLQGEVSNPDAIAMNWPVAVTRPMGDMSRSSMEPEARPAAGQITGSASDAGTVKDRNLEKGRNVAIMGFPGIGNVPELHVSLIHELPDYWRMDVPNNIDGQKLHDSVLRNLTFVGEHVNQWPANIDDARRLIGQYVVAAVYDVAPQQISQQVPTP